MEALFILLPGVFALADRGIGGLLRRSFVVGGMLLGAAVLGYFNQPLAALLIAVWLVYRTIPWKVGGSITPRTTMEIGASLLRHAMPALAVLLAYTWYGVDPQAALPIAAYALAATGMGVAYANHVDKLASQGLGDNGDYNDRLEAVRGGLFGFAAALALMLA